MHTVEDVIRLLKEVAAHRKRTKLVINYDGEKFYPTFEELKLSPEEYMMLSERRSKTPLKEA